MRLDRPIGWWLLLLPGWWSITMASFGAPHIWSMALFFIGAVVMRGAGCTYNDIVDRDIDAKVARTARRPLPSGQVSVRAAWVFLGAQLLVGLGVLLQFNPFAVLVGAASLLLVAAYPFMKRITYWPQAWLGLTFNWGALVGWAAVAGKFDTQTFLLYGAGFFWTLGYDTIYAHQDREDDTLAGVKSSALALGERTRPIVAVFYMLAIGLLATVLMSAQYNPLGLAFLAAAAAHLAWQVATLDIANPDNCLRRSRSNRDFGLLVLAAIWAVWMD
jgi:4-hydroxybenzoate polyprenyltransferase